MKRKLLAALAALGLAYVVALSACTSLSHHTASPYDENAEQAAALERDAAAWCAKEGSPGGEPTLPFRFDGCSWSPDQLGSWQWRDCCQRHDYAYWCGGSEADRERADRVFGECVAKEANGAVGWVMKTGVRAGGHPIVPLYFRWGYGHPYAGCYPETPAQGAPRP
jgi:hypothetical protein